MAEAQRQKLIKIFESVEYFSATADIWSRSNRSFLAVSVHYIELETNNLKTVFIACVHFPGSHTHDRVAEKLALIFTSYGILEKVFFITTDSAGEFVAAFKYFGDDYRSIRLLIEGEDQFDSDSDNEDDYDAGEMIRRRDRFDLNSPVYDATETFAVHDAFDYDSDTDPIDEHAQRLLPNLSRIGCSSHKLDKVASIDALTARRDANYAEMYDKVFEKLDKLWGLKSSRLKAEVFTEITKRKLIGPHRIRWLKTFDAVRVH